MSVSDKFSTFCCNLRMNTSTVDKVRTRYNNITRIVNLEFWYINSDIRNSIYVGSYGRGTDIHVSDIDMIVTLPDSVYANYSKYLFNGQSALLQALKKVIQKTYPSTSIRGDGQVVVINFYDGIRFEIVPAFKLPTGDYRYPDTNNGGSWKITKPKQEIDNVNLWNGMTNKNLKRLCRMARAWKEEWQVPISGILIDTLAVKFLSNYVYKDSSFVLYDWMTRDFFKFLSEQNPSQKYWYAPGSMSHVYRTGYFEYKAKCCYNLALDAIAYEEANYSYTANQKWREIYGTKFPA